MRIGVFDLYKTDTQIKNGHFVVYIGVCATKPVFERISSFAPKKKKVRRRCEGRRPSFVNRTGLTKSQPYRPIRLNTSILGFNYLLIDLFDRLVKKNTSTLKPNFDAF